jgi:hypothetical protein
MRLPALIAVLALIPTPAAASGSLADCAASAFPTRCLIEIATREQQRITVPGQRSHALARVLNAAAVARLTLAASADAGERALAEGGFDDWHRLDLLMAVHNYRRSRATADEATRLRALALYHHLAETSAGSARLSLMLTACGVADLPAELAKEWQVLADHGCTPAFLDETALPADTDRLMALLLAPIVFYREDESEAFEAAIDRAHAAALDMDTQMEGKPADVRAAWQQLKAGMYLLHGTSFIDAGDPLRARLSAAASYAAILAAEEIGTSLMGEERAGVAGLLMRTGQTATAEQILDETTRAIDADGGRQRIPAKVRVGFVTALIELLAEGTEPLECPIPGEGEQPAV